MTDRAPIVPPDVQDLPLDLLLDLVRGHDIDLATIPIAALIGAFAQNLETALETAPLTRWADWLVAAATLTLLATALLNPPTPKQQADAAAEAEILRLRLQNRAMLMAATDWLQSRPQLGHQQFPRGQTSSPGDIPTSVTITALFRACLAALALPGDSRTDHATPIPRLWRPAEATQRILALIETLPDESPLEAYLPRLAPHAPQGALRARAAVASTLVASLELTRQGLIEIGPHIAGGPIRLRRYLTK